VPWRAEPVDMTQYPQGQLLLQRLRDEAHRFAISHHRGRRERRMSESVLDGAEGIGPRRRRALLKAFRSVEAIAEASVEQLAAVPGMTLRSAEALRRYLDERAREEEDTQSVSD